MKEFSDRLERMFDSKLPKAAWRIWLARGIAVAADVLQVAMFPTTVEGAFSPISDGLDIVVAVMLTLLVGWHIAFVPSFLVKLLPFADLAPTWTVAILFVTRGSKGADDNPSLLESSGGATGAHEKIENRSEQR